MIKVLFVENNLPDRILISSRIPDYCIVINVDSITDVLPLIANTETDILILGPSIDEDCRRLLTEARAAGKPERIIIFSRETVSAVADCESGTCSDVEYINLPHGFDLFQKIFYEIFKNRLNEIMTSSTYRLNKKMSALIGSSHQISDVKDRIIKFAPAPGPVLITGESGTGKDIVARLLHELSDRSDSVFHPLNAATIAKELAAVELFGSDPGAYTGARSRHGCFEYSDGGTLFLDEIAELDMQIQAELLRTLESGLVQRVGGNKKIAVDVRLIAATNCNLATAVNEGRFRSDLLYRIDMFRIHLAPLRARKEDIPDLLMHFSEQLRLERPNRHWEFSDSFLDKLFDYDWPGNIRELRNVFRRAVYTADSTILTAESVRFDY
ncbi:MAG: sigma 54-interacting transcriptional regulator [Spirochaetales bacterium]|uniref:Sigma 54-interacting transcriptional regulator n=1 Tax=Candidatus Thalassospirochaeta sargassi TaxID=3119039 RepID=A0AAJ1IDI8_9SPIO|nr:sigma 54-interacting transcriptional regulator [Spirochaetales bacterium]